MGGKTADLTLINGRFGWKSNSWYGAEGDLFFGVNKDAVEGAPPLKVKIDSAAFIYGVAYILVGKKVDLLVRAGYGHQATTVSGAASGLANDGAFAYGAGAQVMIDDKSGVRADYSHLDVSQAPMKLWTVSYVRKF